MRQRETVNRGENRVFKYFAEPSCSWTYLCCIKVSMYPNRLRRLRRCIVCRTMHSHHLQLEPAWLCHAATLWEEETNQVQDAVRLPGERHI